MIHRFRHTVRTVRMSRRTYVFRTNSIKNMIIRTLQRTMYCICTLQ